MNGGLHLYIIQSAVTGAFKVGRSSDPDRRLRDLQTGSPHRLKIILVVKEEGWRERFIHHRLNRFRSQGPNYGEWFLEPGLSSLPPDIYEQLDLDEVNTWWEAEDSPQNHPGPPVRAS